MPDEPPTVSDHYAGQRVVSRDARAALLSMGIIT
jgi:hypothetical protein